MRLALLALACGAAVAVVLLVGRSGDPGRAPAAAQSLSVRVSFEPPTVQFGDPFTAHVAVVVEPHASVQVDERLAPLTRLGTTRTTTDRGRLHIVTVDVRAVCLAEACAARSGDTPVRLAPVRVTAGSSRGTARWPTLHVHSRVAAADLAASAPRFRGETGPPPPGYRISPATLALVLDVLASLLAVGAVVLGAGELMRLRRRRSRRVPGELELALLRARQAEGRPAADRRRALALLARALDRRSSPLASAAADLAWSRPAPARDELAQLAGDVERTVAE